VAKRSIRLVKTQNLKGSEGGGSTMNTKSMVDIAQTAKEMTHNVVNVTITMVLLQAPTEK
jgi:hypothetical protein